MSKSVVIIGASGHGKVIADIIIKCGDSIVGYLDDNEGLGESFNGYPVLGKIEKFVDYVQYPFVVAIGHAGIRERIVNEMNEAGSICWYTAIHPTAVIAKKGVAIGEGTVVMATAVINPGARIGKHCIINTAAVVEHDNIIEDFAHISVGAKLAGTVTVGKASWIGIGAVISNNISICSDCVLGAGAVVVKDIKERGIYMGVPAKNVKTINIKPKTELGGGRATIIDEKGKAAHWIRGCAA